MVFKRRDRRPYWKIIADFFWPKGGWARAFHYTKHRLRRLPDTPEKIARGIFAGIFTVFTPFFGMHFVVSALIAVVVRGNVIAALLGTFLGNPLTYVPIGAISIQTGYWILGIRHHGDVEEHRSFGGKFVDAADDLKDNVLALFTNTDANWHGLSVFYHQIFFPYMIGGIIPGIVAGLVGYYVSVPLIRAYQARRRGTLKAKLAAIRAKSTKSAGPKAGPGAGSGKGKAKQARESGNGN